MKAHISWFVILLSITTAENLNDTTNHLFKNNIKICTNPECNANNREFEQAISLSMNTSVNPCDNFYEFVCGNFDDDNFSSRASGEILSYRLKSLENSILENNLSHPFEIFDFLKKYMVSCKTLNNEKKTSTPDVEKKRVNYLKEILSKFGGWPVVEGSEWNDTHFDWTEFGIKAESSGITAFPFIRLDVTLTKNYKDLHIKPPRLEFSVKKLSSNESVSRIQAYRNHMVEVAKFLGATENQVEQLNKSLEFELKLINISKNKDVSSNNSNHNNVMSIKEMTAKWPSINWTKFFSSRPQSIFYITNETRIFIKYPEYITSFEKLVQETPKRVLADFAVWNTIQHLIPLVGSATLFNIRKNYRESFNSSDKMKPLKCFRLLIDEIPEVLLSYYLYSYPIDEGNVALINQIIVDIKEKLIDTVNGSNKFDVKAKNDIIKTLNSLKSIICRTHKVVNEKKLNEYFRGLEITNDNFLMNHLNVIAFKHSKFQENLASPINLFDPVAMYSGKPLFLTIAGYFVPFNFLIVGPKALTDFWISKDLPNYVNYGSMGSIIAHELGHSVDTLYKTDNIYGIRENGWSAMSNEKYKETEACLIEQFDNYTFIDKDKQLNGTQYLKENIADLVGVKIAYSAYQDLVQKHGLELPYSSLPYTTNQLFWLSYANQWCPFSSSYRRFVKNSHAPIDKRVIGSLSNSPEFAKDFNCPVGSKMNPRKKCDLF